MIFDVHSKGLNMVKKQTSMGGFLTPSVKRQNKPSGKQESKKGRSAKNQRKAVRRSERQAKRQAQTNQSPDDSDVIQPRKRTTEINRINDSGEATQQDAIDITAVGDHPRDRSLTDMLSSAFKDDVPRETSSPNARPTQNRADKIKRLETELIEANAQIEFDKIKNDKLQAQIQLLEEDIDKYRTTQNAQKKEIRRLTTANDNLRRELSKHEGMRKYTVQNAELDQSKLNTDPAQIMSLKEQLSVARTSFESLKDHIKSVAGTLMSACDDDDGFQTVTHRRRSRGKNSSHTADAVSSTPIPQAASPTTGQRIPVITTSSTVDASNASPTTYSDVTAGRRRPSANVTIIGTSLTRGVSHELRQQGIQAETYTYPGATIPHIRSRLPYILNENCPPKTVVLQCGGNDCEFNSLEKVQEQYDYLINDVKYHCPGTRVVVSRVPPRKASTETMSKTVGLNLHLKSRNNPDMDVQCVDVCPKITRYYKRDKIHFNSSGVRLYAQKLSCELKNFQVCQENQCR